MEATRSCTFVPVDRVSGRMVLLLHTMISDSTLHCLHPTGHCEYVTFVPVNSHNSEEVLSKKVHFVEHFHPLTVALLDWLAARLKGAVDSCLRFTTHSSAGPFLAHHTEKDFVLVG